MKPLVRDPLVPAQGIRTQESFYSVISEEKLCIRLGAPDWVPQQGVKPQRIENMVGERGFEPLASWSRNKEDEPRC